MPLSKPNGIIQPMSMPAEKPRRYTLDEYFKIARDSEVKLEYIDGEIVAMAGGTYNHSLITTNTIIALGNRLKGKQCRVLESNLRVGIKRSRYTYPDIPVVCGAPQFDPRDSETIVNPRVLIEVLSPSTERSDRGEKVNRYRLPDAPRNARDRLIDKAIDLFYRHGFNAIGLDRIIDEVGVTKTTFYKYFQSKDDLMVAAVRKRDEWEGKAWGRAVRQAAGDDPRAQLLAFFDVMDIWFNAPDFRGCMFLNTAAEFPNPHDP